MLDFERFRAYNAYPFKEIDLDLRKQGLVRMVGPNGAGKSSVWHLFTQGCQGSSPNSAKKSDIMISEKDFLLEITFRKNGSQYVAATATKAKYKSPAGAPYGTGVYLFRDGQDISMHKDPDTLKLIKSTLGWSIEEWYGYVYLAQMTTHTLINGTRSDRQNYLSALFNLQPLDVLALYFKKKAEDLTLKVDAIERDKQELAIKENLYGQGSHDTAKREHQEVVETLVILEGKLKKQNEEQRRFEARKNLEEKLATLTVEEKMLEDLCFELKDLEDKNAQAASNRIIRAEITKALLALKEVAEPVMPSGWQDEYATSPDIDQKKEQADLSRLTQLEHNLVEVPDVQIPLDLATVLSSPDINIAQVKKQIVEIENRPAPPSFPKPTPEQLATLRDGLSGLSYNILNLRTEIQRLQFNQDTCDKCGTHLDCADRASKLKTKADELNEYQDEQTVASTKLKTQETRQTVWQAYEALGPDRSGELPELKASIELFEKKQQYLKIQAAAKARELYDNQRTECAAIPALKERIRIYQLKAEARLVESQRIARQAYLAEHARLSQQLANTSELPNRQPEIDAVKRSIASWEARIRLGQELFPLQDAHDRSVKIQEIAAEKDAAHTNLGTLKGSLERFDRLAADIYKLQETIASQDQTIRDQKRYALLAKGYGKAGGLRELQLAKFSRYLEEALLAHTIRQLPNHRFHIKVDDGIDILAEYIGKEKPATEPYDIKFMSGGEKGALSVAFLFALDDLLPPDRRSNVKIIDEIEASFDSERQQDFIQYTLPELRSRAETVVVISHSHAANSGAFDKVWEIKSGVVKDMTKDARAYGA